MAIFFPPPQAPQAPPYVPIPRQGDQPAKQPPLGTVNQITLRTAWEPPPPMPAQKPLTIVPLTLVYGSQPAFPNQPLLIAFQEIRAAWEPPWYPAQSEPENAAWNVAAPVLAPPVYNPTPLFAAIRLAWEPPPPAPVQLPLLAGINSQPPVSPPPPWSIVTRMEVRQTWEPPDPQPTQRPLLIAPLTLPTGQQPPPGPEPFAELGRLLRQSWTPPDPQPTQGARTGVVLAMPRADAPPFGANPFAVIENLVYASWPALWWPSQVLPYSFSWNVPAVNVPTPTSIVNQTIIRQTWEPPPPLPDRHPPYAPIPAQGQAPPVGPGQAQQNQSIVRAAWEPPPPQAPQGPLTGAVLMLATGQQPPPSSLVALYVVRQTWEPPPPQAPQLPLTIAPLTLSYGQQPPPSSIVVQVQTRQAWEPPPPLPWQIPPYAPIPVQFAAPTPALPLSAAQQAILRAAWEPPPPQAPQGPLTGVILAQPPVSQPPPYSLVVFYAARLTWEPPWYGTQAPQGGIGWVPHIMPPPPVPFSPFPWNIRAAWEPPWTPAQHAPSVVLVGMSHDPPIPSSAVNLLTIVRSWQPPDPLPLQKGPGIYPGWSFDFPPPSSLVVFHEIRRLWEPPDPLPVQRPLIVALVPLIYGQQPPPYSIVLPAEIRQFWEPPWTGAQRTPPGAAELYVTPVVAGPFVPFAGQIGFAFAAAGQVGITFVYAAQAQQPGSQTGQAGY